MKKMFILMVLVITSSMCRDMKAETNIAATSEAKIRKEVIKTGEQIFLAHADECLAIIEKAAQKLAITGAAMIAFIPGDVSETWISKMKVMGVLSRLQVILQNSPEIIRLPNYGLKNH